MAIIRNGNNVAGSISNELKIAKNSIIEPSIELDLTSRAIIKTSFFPVIVEGDNNSIILIIKAPKNYNNKDLSNINCIVSYETDWTDENGKNSMGQVDLTSSRSVNETYILYTWVLDVQQTAKAGKCNFNIHFFENLETDPSINNVNVYTSFIPEEDNAISFTQDGIVETELRYWSFSCIPNSFEIKPNATRLGADYNLILPPDFEAQLNAINEIVESVKETQKEAQETTASIAEILTNLKTELEEL